MLREHIHLILSKKEAGWLLEVVKAHEGDKDDHLVPIAERNMAEQIRIQLEEELEDVGVVGGKEEKQ